jgi:excisionase family DNA binding protein
MSNTPRKPVQKVTSTNFGPDNLHLALNLEPYVNASDAANFLGIHPKTVMRLARDGVLPAYSFTDGTRHRWRFLKSELDIWMRSRLNSTSHPVRSVS